MHIQISDLIARSYVLFIAQDAGTKVDSAYAHTFFCVMLCNFLFIFTWSKMHRRPVYILQHRLDWNAESRV